MIRKQVMNLLLTIPLLNTFYLRDGSYVWKAPDN